eukprot:GHVU01145885.1.p2 GENE.GHVU01145885.1~~GHVU01145885.1.p2  ORF type:complete len:143 (-),score=45.86 GHVU01145885.1:1496-1924(-)
MTLAEDDVISSLTMFIERLGKPFNYLPSDDEEIRLAEEKLIAEERERKEAKERQLAEEKKAVEEARAARREEEEAILAKVDEHENELLAIRSIPLRQYLLKTVATALTRGLVEIVNTTPEDPLAFLAEYLIEHAEDDLDDEA